MIELVACLTGVVVLGALMLPALSAPRCRCGGQLRDSTQVRGILQAMVIWAQDHGGRYPLPSLEDPSGTTVPGPDWSKDTTGNILSILVWNGDISTELCVSPHESNIADVKRCDTYEYASPKVAARPADALWDPAFRGTPWDEPRGAGRWSDPGHQSYATLVPLGARRDKLWRDTYSATQPIIGNRGPAYAADDRAPSPASGRWALVSGRFGTASNTLLIHGGRTTWEGNIAYNDGHVTFETRPDPPGVTYPASGGTGGGAVALSKPDNLFVDECDEVGGDVPGSLQRGLNAYLRPVAGYAAPGAPILWRD